MPRLSIIALTVLNSLVMTSAVAATQVIDTDAPFERARAVPPVTDTTQTGEFSNLDAFRGPSTPATGSPDNETDEAAPPESTTTTSPPGPWIPGTAEVEDLVARDPVSASGASGGRAVRVDDGTLSVPGPGNSGVLDVTWRVRADDGRVRVTVDGERIGEYGATGSWQDVRGLAWIEAGEPIGIEIVGNGTMLVDQISASDAGTTRSVRGRHILDTSGERYVPRGVNRTSLESSVDGWYWNWRDADAMQSWGVDMVRVPLSQMFWLEESCYSEARYRDNVDKAVRLITNRGMVALLDLHRSSRGETCGVHDRQGMPDELSVEFWEQLAERYADNPLVAFHLYNEPRVHDADLWRDGGDVGNWTTVGMQDLYDAVRSTGAPNLVFVSGGGWGTDLRLAEQRPLDGFGIVYAPHVYNNGDDQLPDDLGRYVDGTAADHPVVVTEFGTNLASGAFNQAAIDWAESNGFGWIAYAWGASDPTQWVLLESWDTYEPNVAGEPVRAALRNHSG